jgi:hypothetical protein
LRLQLYGSLAPSNTPFRADVDFKSFVGAKLVLRGTASIAGSLALPCFEFCFIRFADFYF